MEDALFPHEPPLRWEYTDINALLIWATLKGMSDLLLCSGSPAWMRLHGKWRTVSTRPISADELLLALERLTKNNSVAAMIKSGQRDYDFAYQLEERRGLRRRYRGNATPVADGYSTGVKIVFRALPFMPPTLDELQVEPGMVHEFMRMGNVAAEVHAVHDRVAAALAQALHG